MDKNRHLIGWLTGFVSSNKNYPFRRLLTLRSGSVGDRFHPNLSIFVKKQWFSEFWQKTLTNSPVNLSVSESFSAIMAGANTDRSQINPCLPRASKQCLRASRFPQTLSMQLSSGATARARRAMILNDAPICTDRPWICSARNWQSQTTPGTR
jgi:hypothetical protein